MEGDRDAKKEKSQSRDNELRGEKVRFYYIGVTQENNAQYVRSNLYNNATDAKKKLIQDD